MTDVFKFLIDSIYKFIYVLADRTTFTFFDVELNFFMIMLVSLIFGFIISIFWKGARS